MQRRLGTKHTIKMTSFPPNIFRKCAGSLFMTTRTWKWIPETVSNLRWVWQSKNTLGRHRKESLLSQKAQNRTWTGTKHGVSAIYSEQIWGICVQCFWPLSRKKRTMRSFHGHEMSDLNWFSTKFVVQLHGVDGGSSPFVQSALQTLQSRYFVDTSKETTLFATSQLRNRDRDRDRDRQTDGDRERQTNLRWKGTSKGIQEHAHFHTCQK